MKSSSFQYSLSLGPIGWVVLTRSAKGRINWRGRIEPPFLKSRRNGRRTLFALAQDVFPGNQWEEAPRQNAMSSSNPYDSASFFEILRKIPHNHIMSAKFYLSSIWLFAIGVASAQSPAIPAALPANPGDALVFKAAKTLWNHPGWEAEIRQSIDLFGQRLEGRGSYAQARKGPVDYSKLELRVKVAGQDAHFRQICDGEGLWVEQSLPAASVLGRVDLKTIHEAAEEQKNERFVDGGSHWMALGGLPKLLDSLAKNFQFAPPQEAVSGKLPVLMLQGNWKPESLMQLLPEQKTAIQTGQPVRFPRRFPESVLLVLGKNDLIPYRIEYRKLSIEPTADLSPRQVWKKIVVIELYNVRANENLKPANFQYPNHGEKEPQDYTGLYLQSLGLNGTLKR